MNKFSETTQKSLEIGHKFNIFEIALFELYLLAFGFALCTMFPKIILANPKLFFVYLILFLIGASYTFYVYFKKNRNLQKRWKMSGINIHLLKNFSYLDFAVYKLTVVFFAIILCYFFPNFFLKSEFTPWYTLIFGVGLGYFVARFNMKVKEKKKNLTEKIKNLF